MLGKEIGQGRAIQPGDGNHGDDSANPQQQQGKENARLQLRDFEAVGEGIDDGFNHAPDGFDGGVFAGLIFCALASSQVPPLPSIFDLAEALKACALTVSFLSNSPSPRILTPSARPLARPAFRNMSRSTRPPSSNWFSA